MPSLRRLSAVLLPLVPLAITACADDETHTAIVAPLLSPCQGVGAQLCLSVSVDGGAPERMYDGIEGFTFRWGVEATVRYRVEEVEPVADGSSRRYILEELVSERADAAGPTFGLDFDAQPPGDGWFSANGSGEVSMAGTRVACTEPVCSSLVELAGDARVTFELTGAADVPLRATGISAN